MCQILEEALDAAFPDALDGGRFTVRGLPEDALLPEGRPAREGDCGVAARLSGGSRRLTLEVEVFFGAAESPRLEREARLHTAIDALGWLLERLLVEDPELLPPLDWQPLSFVGQHLWIRGDQRDEALLAAADALLNSASGAVEA